jgi:hypothetical protein
MTASAAPAGQSPIASRQSPIVSVSSEIGRGHPSYLDSVLLALERLGARLPHLTVPGLCVGVAGLAWRLARFGYRFGSRGGAATWLYNRLRSPDSKPSGLQLALLGTSLRRLLTGYDGICIVDHPLLAYVLAPVCRVAYLHCEIAAPGLAAVPGAWRTLVPLERTARRLEAFGVGRDKLEVTGLVVEPELADVAESAFQARMARMASDRPLTIGFFASGAEPRPHSLRTIVGATSVTRAGHKALLAWGTGMLAAAKVQLALRRQGAVEESVRVLWARTRQAATAETARILPELDVIVCAAHERTNWAVGLGLPMFVLLPHIGPFARENFEFASEQGVCLPLTTPRDAAALGPTLAALRRDGRLAQMARSGWGRHAITGADAIARSLLAATESGT